MEVLDANEIITDDFIRIRICVWFTKFQIALPSQQGT